MNFYSLTAVRCKGSRSGKKEIPVSQGGPALCRYGEPDENRTPLSQIRSAGLKSVTPIADPASVRIRRSEPIQKSDPYRSFGGLKSVTPVANLSLHWRPQKCDPYRRFASSMRPRPQFGDPYRSFVDPADPDEIRWARNCDTYRTIRLARPRPRSRPRSRPRPRPRSRPRSRP